MKSRVLVFIIFTISLFALGLLVTTLFNTSPTSLENVLMMYFSLFLTLVGLFFFINYGATYKRMATSPNLTSVWSMLKLALILDVLILTLIFLKSTQVLNAPTTIILMIVAVIVALITKKRWLK